jgi:DNA-directed RNA polymerase subunit M/transcription elongation factor TFIIS
MANDVAATDRNVNTDRCHRCGGLMVPEQVVDIRSIDFRCVSCGERIDPVILAHRRGTHTVRKSDVHSHTKRTATIN